MTNVTCGPTAKKQGSYQVWDYIHTPVPWGQWEVLVAAVCGDCHHTGGVVDGGAVVLYGVGGDTSPSVPLWGLIADHLLVD